MPTERGLSMHTTEKGRSVNWGTCLKASVRLCISLLKMSYCFSCHLEKYPDASPRPSDPCPVGLQPSWLSFVFPILPVTLQARTLPVPLPGVLFLQIVTQLCRLPIDVSALIPPPHRALTRPSHTYEALSPDTAGDTNLSQGPT